MTKRKVHLAAGRIHILCETLGAGEVRVKTADAEEVTCARCLRLLSAVIVKFSDVLPGERFSIHKRNRTVWRGVKVIAFTDGENRSRNSIEVGTGLFWTTSTEMPVWVDLPRPS